MREGPARHLRLAGLRFPTLARALLFACVALVLAAPDSPARQDGAAVAVAHEHARGALPDHPGHEVGEGYVLVAGTDRPRPGVAPRCAPQIRTRSYDVVAINVDITINRYLDHDPQGRMYVLEEDLARVRAEERQNADARARAGEPAVTIGVQGDAIQPLTLRVNQGECLRVRLRNDLRDGEVAGLHIHGASEYVAGTATPSVDANPASYAAPGSSVTYEWLVAASEPEGTHYFHSLGDDRFQTGHGLFGAVIVEPQGSQHLDQSTGREVKSGWSAVIRGADGRSFREAVLYYHEIGNELYQLLDRSGNLVPLVDPITSAYRPGARALNYRSEPFMNRLALQQSLVGRFDESLAYSSYAFGDPATPILRSYLGDPLKQRLVHGGSEVFHVHHVHGGSIRWPRQPGTQPGAIDRGLDKHPPLTPPASERVDAQSVGPAETFDIEDECGSGGCQQSVGDFLIHCHVAHHYFAGMWGLWRVYNTNQDGVASTDTMPPLLELPDRGGRVRPAVTSSQLVGTTVDSYGKRTTLAAGELASWVEAQLPPAGSARGYDASVLDWAREGALYLNEPEDGRAWPGHRSSAPSTRPPLRFDPATGKLAYPFLRPHLGKRPPFAPNHGPAPFLDPLSPVGGVPEPGANGPASVCPAGTRIRSFVVDAIAVAIPVNRRANLVDPDGEIYVLGERARDARADERERLPLTIRANAGEDCVDLMLVSELEDSPDNHGFSKVNLHIHFVQFDVQASDGVIAGFNYEQSVRPFTAEGERVRAAAAAGATSLRLSSAARFRAAILVGVGMGRSDTFEVARVKTVEGDALTFDAPLRFAHGADEIVSTEFVRYRWYPDAQFGSAYFHDHVNAIVSWRHGLFGALIAEPPGSTYHDPATGAEVRSGPLADVRTNGSVSVDVRGSFREIAMFVQDDSPINHVGRSSGSLLNLRAEPLSARAGDPAERFDSRVHGDPATPIVNAYLGDPVVVRALVGATNAVHTWHLDGHTFRVEPYSATSPPTSTIHLGISERYDLSVARAGGPQNMPGDYLYYNGRSFTLEEGSWGLLRVHASPVATLRPLPGHESIPAPATSVCPAGAPARRFAIAAIEVALPMLDPAARGRIFALQSDGAAFLAGGRAPEPLVLHVGVGDCVVVELRNELTGGAVSFHADQLSFDPRASGGVNAGNNPAQTVAPGATRTYTYYAHPGIGETVALVRDWGDVSRNPGRGLYGAIVVGPAGARYTDPATGEDVAAKSSWRVDVHPREGPAYRDFALFLQDEDAGIGTHRMPYTDEVEGVVGVNYRYAPLRERIAKGGAATQLFSGATHGDPSTPLLEAFAGDDVRLHVLAPWSEQAHVFALEGHRWPFERGRQGTSLLSAVQLGGLEAVTLFLEGGAGGPDAVAGDYVYGDHRTPYRDAGLWGIFRVREPCADSAPPLRPLTPCAASAPSTPLVPVALGAGAVLLLGLGFALYLYRGRAPAPTGR